MDGSSVDLFSKSQKAVMTDPQKIKLRTMRLQWDIRLLSHRVQWLQSLDDDDDDNNGKTSIIIITIIILHLFSAQGSLVEQKN